MKPSQHTGVAGMSAAGVVLKDRAAEIVARWIDQSMDNPQVAGSSRAALRDHFPHLLSRLGEDLIQGGTRQSALTEQAAETHGQQRWELGWRLDELVRDYQTLRPVIEEVLFEYLGTNFTPPARRALNRMLDEAIVDSIDCFTQYHQQLTVESRQAAAVLAAIVNCSADAIISMSMAGKILSWNQAAEQLYGYRAEEVIGRHARLLYPQEDVDQLEMFLSTVGRGESVRLVDTIRLAKDGTRLQVAISVSPVRADGGEVIGCATIEQGISQRVEAARALRQAVSEAEQANRTKTEFLANVSHELRSPMNAIIGMTALSLEEQLTPTLRDNLLTIREGATQMLHLIDDLLDVARLESRAIENEDQPFELRATLDNTMKIASVRAAQKGLELVCRIESDVPDNLRGDPGRLQQVLGNLIDNAVKFTDQGEVVVEIQQVGGDETTCSLRISVTDTGIGILPEDQSRIFAPFAQVDTSSTRRFSGTGLGLTIACHGVSSLGGRLAIESTPGVGSKFWFVAQFGLRPADLQAGQPPGVNNLLVGIPILVVDDNLSNRRALSELLESWGMRVVAVEGAAQALAALQGRGVDSQPIRLALVDALMPGTDGLELADKIVTLEGAPPVIVMLAPSDRAALRERLSSARLAGTLDKPVGESKLHDTILGTVLAGVKSVEVKCQPPMTSLAGPVASLNVLLVEDTVANRKVVERVLGKRGHRVINAFNGREAIELVRQEQFDVILMDVQMPIMDGFQAATAIRQWEAENKIHPTPIIAMTAHAMRADRDRCFAAGMSGYIAKPMDIYLLAKIVESSAQNPADRVPLPRMEAANQVRHLPKSDTAATPDHRESIDLDQACKRLRGDRVLLDELVRCYRDDHQNLLNEISEALEQGEAKVAHRMAHNLKGLASNFDAVRTPYFAQQIELACAAGDLTEARRNLPMLVESARELAKLLP